MWFIKKYQEESRIIRNQQQNKLTESQIQSLKFQLDSVEQNYQQEQILRKKECEKNKQLNQLVQELQSSLNKKIDELNATRCQAEIEYEQLKRQMCYSEQANQSLINNISELEQKLLEYTQSSQKEIYDLQANLEKANEQAKQLRLKINDLGFEIQQKDEIINHTKDFKDKQIMTIGKQDDSKSQQIAIYQMKEKQMLFQINEQTNEIYNLKQENQYLKSLIENKKKDFEVAQKKLFSELDKEKGKIEMMEQKRIQLINRIKLQNVKKAGLGKIYSPTEALKSNKTKNPFEFLNDPNIMSKDLRIKVEMIKIDLNKAFDNLIKKYDTDITKFIIRQSIGEWSGKRSINNNGEGTKRKCYLFKVLNSQGNHYNNDVFMIKELIGQETMTSFQDAMIVAQNNQIAQALAIFYQNELKKRNVKLACQFEFTKQYLLCSNGNYYIAEKLKKGEFVKYNGEGNSQNKNQEITSFLNAFSLFTYDYTEKLLMVTNLQGMIGKKKIILFDPIISTHEGNLSEEDLTESHILQFLSESKINPKEYGKTYLDQIFNHK